MRSRPPTNPEALIAYRVRELRNKFEYPDELGGSAPAIGEGAGGAPTVVVAASDASALSKEKADFVCTGVNDEAILQQAHDVMEGGGRILLTEGIFECGTSTVFFGAAVTVQGMGRSTVINTTSTGTVWEFTGANVIVRDLVFSGTNDTAPNRFIKLNDSYGLVENVGFQSGAVAINFQGQKYTIRGCDTTNVPLFIDASPFGSNAIITDNGLTDTSGVGVGRILLGASAKHWVIANNILSGSIEDSAQAHTDIVIADNIWAGVDYISSGHAIIDFVGSTVDSFVVAGNVVSDGGGNPFLRAGTNTVSAAIQGNVLAAGVTDGILFQGAGASVGIDGNIMTCTGSGITCDTTLWEDGRIGDNHITAGEFGMDLDGVDRCHIVGNTIITPGFSVDNTFDGIRLSSTCDNNFITGNRITVFGFGNQARYGINIAGTCNIVVGNDIGASVDYGTDNLNDAGTDTRLVYPNDPTIGDNFGGCFGS